VPDADPATLKRPELSAREIAELVESGQRSPRRKPDTSTIAAAEPSSQ